jgi:hypothetical protein
MAALPTTFDFTAHKSATFCGVDYIGIPLKDLPEVTGNERRYESGTAAHAPASFPDINTRIKQLVAIKMRMEADTKLTWGEAQRRNDARLEELKAAEAKKAHDELRTSPIALKALAIYNKQCETDHKSWDATNLGEGAADNIVQDWIREAYAADKAEKDAAEKLTARRDAITVGLVGVDVTYDSRIAVIKRAVDRIIELEDKAGK